MWYSSLYLYTSGISNGAWVSFAPGTSRSSVLPSNTYTTGKQKHPNILFLTLETASIDRQATGRQSSRKSWGAPLIHLPSPQPTSYCFPLLPFSFLYNFWVCVWEACQSLWYGEESPYLILQIYRHVRLTYDFRRIALLPIVSIRFYHCELILDGCGRWNKMFGFTGGLNAGLSERAMTLAYIRRHTRQYCIHGTIGLAPPHPSLLWKPRGRSSI